MSTEVTLFKNAAGATCVILPTLERINFHAGKFFTTDKSLEAKLKRFSETRDYGIYIDPEEPTVDTAYQNPVDALRAKLKAQGEVEFRQKLLEMSNNPEFKDLGISRQSLEQFLSSVSGSLNELQGAKPQTEEQKTVQQSQQQALTQPASASAASLLAQLNKPK